MTSMPFTVSMVALIGAFSFGSSAFPETQAEPPEKPPAPRESRRRRARSTALGRGVLGAIARGKLLFRRIRGCRRANQRLDDLQVGLVRAGGGNPLLSVPGFDAAAVRTLVVDASGLDDIHETGKTDLLDRGGVERKVFQTPAHLLAG